MNTPQTLEWLLSEDVLVVVAVSPVARAQTLPLPLPPAAAVARPEDR